MPDALWTLHDNGRFELNEPYRTLLEEARFAATSGWTLALMEYLEPRSPYTLEELKASLLERNEREGSRVAVFEEFVLEALSGDL